MTTRILEPSEWQRIRDTGLDFNVWSSLDPASARIVVVEDADGTIAACWGTFAVRHVEGFWVRPDHRQKGGALRRLFVGMRELLVSLGSTTVVTQAETDEIANLLQSAGASRLPGTSFLLPVDFGPWAKE